MTSTSNNQRHNKNLTVKPDRKNPDLPPPRRGKAVATHKTHLPGSKIAFSKFIYILSAILVAFIAFNLWRLAQYKTAAGGWRNLVLGTQKRNDAASPSSYNKYAAQRESVEDHIVALAKALGLPSRDLASAIAEAVRDNLPPASLSSVSVAEATKSGLAVNAIIGDEEEVEEDSGGAARGALAGMGEKLNVLSSFDDPEPDIYQ